MKCKNGRKRREEKNEIYVGMKGMKREKRDIMEED